MTCLRLISPEQLSLSTWNISLTYLEFPFVIVSRFGFYSLSFPLFLVCYVGIFHNLFSIFLLAHLSFLFRDNHFFGHLDARAALREGDFNRDVNLMIGMNKDEGSWEKKSIFRWEEGGVGGGGEKGAESQERKWGRCQKQCVRNSHFFSTIIFHLQATIGISTSCHNSSIKLSLPNWPGQSFFFWKWTLFLLFE